MDTAVRKSREGERCRNSREVGRGHEGRGVEEDPGAEREGKNQDLKAEKGTEDIPILTKETDIVRHLKTEKDTAQDRLSLMQDLTNTGRDLREIERGSEITLQYTI